jgi:hypothetical protein
MAQETYTDLCEEYITEDEQAFIEWWESQHQDLDTAED